MLDAFGPLGWMQLNLTEGAAVWRKTLHESSAAGSFNLLRFEPGSRLRFHSSPVAIRLLVLGGALETAYIDKAGGTHTSALAEGALIERPPGMQRSSWSRDGCLCLLLLDPVAESAEGFDASRPARLDSIDAFAPSGWHPAQHPGFERDVAGVWQKPLQVGHSAAHGPKATEQRHRLVRFEPQAGYPQHAHTGPQRLLLLSGDLDDQIIERDETRIARYGAGAFVEYPYPVTHRPLSRQGCLIVVGA